MDILDGVVADDLFLYLPEHKTFILSDIHIGYEESLNRQGVILMMSRTEMALEWVKIDERSHHKIDADSKKSRSLQKLLVNGSNTDIR